jgi:hypothetical protein
MAGYESPDQFREVLDKTFTLMSEDPELGPALKAADTSQRFEFEDLELVLNVRATRGEEEGNLLWKWSDEVDWEPRVRMAMTSEVANRYFQGTENIAAAIATKRIRTGGDVKAVLAIIPATKPVFARYRELVEAEYPHLVA